MGDETGLTEHGQLWVLHESTSAACRGFERNDLFGIFFSVHLALSRTGGRHGAPAARGRPGQTPNGTRSLWLPRP